MRNPPRRGRRSQDQDVNCATMFRSDGEAMCLALGKCRGWVVATDDRGAILVAQQAGLTVVSCPELVRFWAISARVSAASLVHAPTDIQTLAQFRPNPSMPEHKWWAAPRPDGSVNVYQRRANRPARPYCRRRGSEQSAIRWKGRRVAPRAASSSRDTPRTVD
jgi:hypothetical protein